MARFSALVRGALHREPCTLSTVWGQEFTCSLRPLTTEDDALILERARAFAVSRGVAEPRDGDPLYELGKWVWRALLACEDSDAAPGADGRGVAFFDGGEDQVLGALDRDRLAVLVQRQAAVQDAVTIAPGLLSAGEFVAEVMRAAAAGDDERLPFELWRPSTQRAFVRSMARLLSDSLASRSPTTSGSSPEPASSPSPATDTLGEIMRKLDQIIQKHEAPATPQVA